MASAVVGRWLVSAPPADPVLAPASTPESEPEPEPVPELEARAEDPDGDGEVWVDGVPFEPGTDDGAAAGDPPVEQAVRAATRGRAARAASVVREVRTRGSFSRGCDGRSGLPSSIRPLRFTGNSPADLHLLYAPGVFPYRSVRVGTGGGG